MGEGKIIEDLENLWFFSNILSSPPPPPPLSSPTRNHEKITNVHLSDSPKSNLQEPRFPNVEAERVQASEAMDHQIQTGSELKLELQIVESDSMGALGSPETGKEQRSRTEKRTHKKKCSPKRRAKGQKEFRDFGFTSGYDEGFESRLVPVVPIFQSSGSPYLGSKIPPLSDGIAMKEHIRSWAHAVACTVR